MSDNDELTAPIDQHAGRHLAGVRAFCLWCTILRRQTQLGQRLCQELQIGMWHGDGDLQSL